jgi:hypothetical protein
LSKRTSYRGNFPVRPARTNKATVTAYARPLIASALLASGFVQLAAPVFAQTAPAADSSISNTATASYEDPNAPGVTIDTVSNTVKVKVAKVAGILVVGKGFTDAATPQFNPNHTIYSNFEVTNTGNDGVKFRVPKNATVSTATVNFVKVQYNAGTVSTPDWRDVTDATGVDSQPIAAGGVLQVRVELIVKNVAAGLPIETTLGKTSAAGINNIERGVGVDEDVHPDDIYTVDVTTAGSLVALGGNAANGVREGSFKQTTQVNAVKQAVPSITLTTGTPVPNTTTPATKDDVTYSINVTVPTTDPVTGADTADLAPTSIKLATTAVPGAGTDVNRVLISNPLPAGSRLLSAPTAPANWTVVYAITSPVAGTPTVWATVPPANLANVKQVGFIYETTATAANSVPTVAGTSVSASTTAYGPFNVSITTGGLGTVANTVAVEGTTPGTTTPARADATGSIVTSRGTVASDIYNGPAGVPQAKGPGGDNNLDFTNKSMKILGVDAVRDANGDLKTTTAPTTPVVFSNTVENVTNAASNVYLLPTVAADLPNGTQITLKKSDNTDPHTYTYDKPNGVFTTTNTGLPLTLSVTGLGSAGYIVEVLLPGGLEQLKGYSVPVTAFTTTDATFLATATTAPGIVAVPTSDTKQNTTIDRVYTGYIDLVKEARTVDPATQTIDDADATNPYAKAPTLKAVPGKLIQYRIRAVNVIQPDATAVGSKSLDASSIKMVENGAITGLSNWASTTTHLPNSAKTLLGTTTQPASTITYNSGAKNNTNTDITLYEVNLGTAAVTPGQEASFVFVRKVNLPAQTPGTSSSSSN